MSICILSHHIFVHLLTLKDGKGTWITSLDRWNFRAAVITFKVNNIGLPIIASRCECSPAEMFLSRTLYIAQLLTSHFCLRLLYRLHVCEYKKDVFEHHKKLFATTFKVDFI